MPSTLYYEDNCIKKQKQDKKHTDKSMILHVYEYL